MNGDYFALQFIVFNVFQPPWLTALYGRLFRITGSHDRDARFVELCNNLHCYDICCLQECHNELIVTKLQTFNVCGIDPQPDSKLAKTARSYYYNGSNGGLVTAVRKDLKIIWSYNYKFTYCADEDNLNRSTSFTLINMDSYWSGKYLLVCNLHLYSGLRGNTAHTNNLVREQQRSEVYGQLMQIHEKQLFPLGFSWDKCGVIICGCFNAAADNGFSINHEYTKIKESFGKARDLLATSNVKTFDTDTNQYADQNKLNDSSRMDFIFVLDSIVCDRGTTATLPLKAENAYINTELVISDHYPVCASIYPMDNTTESTLEIPYMNQNQTYELSHPYLHVNPSAPPMTTIWDVYSSNGFNELFNRGSNNVLTKHTKLNNAQKDQKDQKNIQKDQKNIKAITH